MLVTYILSTFVVIIIIFFYSYSQIHMTLRTIKSAIYCSIIVIITTKSPCPINRVYSSKVFFVSDLRWFQYVRQTLSHKLVSTITLHSQSIKICSIPMRSYFSSDTCAHLHIRTQLHSSQFQGQSNFWHVPYKYEITAHANERNNNKNKKYRPKIMWICAESSETLSFSEGTKNQYWQKHRHIERIANEILHNSILSMYWGLTLTAFNGAWNEWISCNQQSRSVKIVATSCTHTVFALFLSFFL